MTHAPTSVEIVLRDGSTAHVRPVVASDRPAIEAFFRSLSWNSRALRFFSAATDLGAVSHLAVETVARGGYGLVATRGDDRIVAHAMYGEPDGDHAEVAFAVADGLHGTGIATILLEHLAEHAHDNGVTRFTAEVLPENHLMIEVFRDSGYALTRRSLPGVVDFEFPTASTPRVRARFEERERIAAAAARRLGR
jgi:GNAT superfamily N-acetyltransferase